jgi:AcrR family transcriptional regulator
VAETTERQRTGSGEAQERLIKAARECFARDGVRKTRMATVAEAAGMVRQTVYSFVSSKEELIELAFSERLGELIPPIVERIGEPPGGPGVELVEVFADMTEVVRVDREFNEYSAALGLDRALRFLTGPTAAHDAVIEIIRPFYARAAHAGVLRSDISLDDTAWWARNVLAPLIVRGDLDGEQLRRIVKKYALPALLTDDR